MIQHVFHVHSMLQFYLALRIISVRELTHDTVMLITLRGLKLPPEATPGCTVVDGDRFDYQYGYAFPTYWRANLRRRRDFMLTVADRLAGHYTLYIGNVARWHCQYLWKHANERIGIEDGLGNMQFWEMENPDDYIRSRLTLGIRLYEWKSALSSIPPFIRRYQKTISYSRSNSFYYHVNPLAFPSIPADKRQLLTEVFPPLHLPVYENQTIWCPSPIASLGILSLNAYQRVLRRVAAQLQQQGVRQLYVKWHPHQQLAGKYIRSYRKIFEGEHNLELIDVPEDISIECLAGGTGFTLLTGVSSLIVYVGSQQRTVLSYYNLLLEEGGAAVNDKFAIFERAFSMFSTPIEA